MKRSRGPIILLFVLHRWVTTVHAWCKKLIALNMSKTAVSVNGGSEAPKTRGCKRSIMSQDWRGERHLFCICAIYNGVQCWFDSGSAPGSHSTLRRHGCWSPTVHFNAHSFIYFPNLKIDFTLSVWTSQQTLSAFSLSRSVPVWLWHPKPRPCIFGHLCFALSCFSVFYLPSTLIRENEVDQHQHGNCRAIECLSSFFRILSTWFSKEMQ